MLIRVLLLAALIPAPGAAQLRSEANVGHYPTASSATCKGATFVIGAAVGFFVGASTGAIVERTLDSSEDAGVTGLAVGGILGAIGGSQLAKRLCGNNSDDALRTRLMMPQSLTGTGGTFAPRLAPAQQSEASGPPWLGRSELGRDSLAYPGVGRVDSLRR